MKQVSMHTALWPQSPSFSHALKKSALCGLMILGLSACQETAPYSRDGDLVKRSTVSMVRLDHGIEKEADQTDSLSRGVQQSILTFIAASQIQHGDVILLDVGQNVNAARVDAVADFVKKQGLRYGGTGIFGSKPTQGEIKLYIERHVVSVPDCGRWAESSTVSHKHNQAMPNFGCSNSRNLGLMVANPKDLVRGEGHPTANTKRAVQAINGTTGPSLSLSIPGLGGAAGGASGSSGNSGGSSN